MNRLPLPKRVQIVHALVEGASLRSASRIADCSINTVYKLLEDAVDDPRSGPGQDLVPGVDRSAHASGD